MLLLGLFVRTPNSRKTSFEWKHSGRRAREPCCRAEHLGSVCMTTHIQRARWRVRSTRHCLDPTLMGTVDQTGSIRVSAHIAVEGFSLADRGNSGMEKQRAFARRAQIGNCHVCQPRGDGNIKPLQLALLDETCEVTQRVVASAS